MPDLNLATESNGKVLARGGECERRDLRSEREVVDGYPAGDVGEDRMAIFVDGEEDVAAGCQTEPRDVLAMRKGQRVRFVPVAISCQTSVP